MGTRGNEEAAGQEETGERGEEAQRAVGGGRGKFHGSKGKSVAGAGYFFDVGTMGMNQPVVLWSVLRYFRATRWMSATVTFCMASSSV